MDCLWNSPSQNTGVGSVSLLQGIFWTQGLNLGLLRCRWILYQLSHKESTYIYIFLTFWAPIRIRYTFRRKTQSLETIMWELDIFMFRKVRGVWSDRGRTTSVPIIQLLQNLRIEPLNWLYGHRVYNQRPSQFLSIKLVAAHLLGDCFVNFQSEGQSPKGGWVWIIVMESNWISENIYHEKKPVASF